MSDKAVPIVVFVTTTFDSNSNGPSVYARYLWQHFEHDPSLDFHVVAPSFTGFPPSDKLHASGVQSSSLKLYSSLADHAIEVADSLGDSVIIHCNHCHISTSFLGRRHRVWGQINDVSNARALARVIGNLRLYGARRSLSLLRRRAIEKAMVESQELTICNSEFTRTSILDAYPKVKKSLLIRLYKAVDLNFFEGALESKAQNTDAIPRLLFVGSDFVTKGLDTLILALGELSCEVVLDVVGVERADFLARFPLLTDVLEALGPSVKFHGQRSREEVKQFFSRANVFVLPSRSEALGVVILEAIASGCFVVASNVDGIPEILQGSNCGVLVSPNNITELAAEIDRCAKVHYWEQDEGYLQDRVKTLSRFELAPMLARLRQLYLAPPERLIELASLSLGLDGD